ncbi:hypothetical protein ET475_04560 [Microbacterium protaetiae]|uniref:Uncharacterized protein n=1 Tax=Microbacterium protaetiae TaxID=2509458 RepID=A0A4P6EBD8_9MICO|nr:hypothetical protein ET475_04560 [Microbacterium protaetiae]
MPRRLQPPPRPPPPRPPPPPRRPTSPAPSAMGRPGSPTNLLCGTAFSCCTATGSAPCPPLMRRIPTLRRHCSGLAMRWSGRLTAGRACGLWHRRPTISLLRWPQRNA